MNSPNKLPDILKVATLQSAENMEASLLIEGHKSQIFHIADRVLTCTSNIEGVGHQASVFR